VMWCRRRLTPYTSGQYRFRHHNVRNGRYNPGGDLLAHEARFPVKRAAFDFCAVFSVFTHMYEADIRHYLEEIRRVLKPGATALTTWFLFDDERLASATDPAQTRFPMVNMINAVTRHSESADPLRAIAYEESFARSMVAEAGLEIVAVERGSWCGEARDEYQDILTLRAPVPRPPTRLRRLLGYVRR
jgi:SAM-dependent methyltransferase